MTQHMLEGRSPFEKNPKLNYWLRLIEIIFPKKLPHPDNYSWRISYEYLSWWPEPTEKEMIRLCLCNTIFIDIWSFMYRKRKNYLNSFFLLLIFLLTDLQFLIHLKISGFSLECLVLKFLFYS